MRSRNADTRRPTLAFDGSTSQHDGGMTRRQPIFFVHAAPQNQIQKAGFVFERDKDDAARRSRLLATSDDTRHFYTLPLMTIEQLLRRDHAPRSQLVAKMAHRMIADRKPLLPGSQQ